MRTTRSEGRVRRHQRIRRRLAGTGDRGRMAVFRSHLHIYAQIVDDTSGKTLVAASSLKLGEVPRAGSDSRRIAQAKAVGRMLAERAKEKGIQQVVFDRSGYRYHGRVAALAAGAREGGLQF
jgi:large subunit ribosomal protein L18